MDDRQPVSLARRALSYLICYLVAVQPMLPVMAAEITPVTPGTKMDAAGNGVPVVNIATPNQAGVSHNQYDQYNVGQQGLILNNATGQLTQTQLGGLIQNNPNLKAGQEARAIINEVVGANRSQLQGYTEVAGKAANVMVANPYGITCNGCGFINTPNVTLTTGKPQFDASGNLAALEVSKGTITIEGQGLDGSKADAVSIVARATEINAGIHAKDLTVTLGANRVGQDGSVTPIRGEGPAPGVAVDTSALGGMYANRIHLVSSEKGVGVNLGNLLARQGDITLDANGKLAVHDSLSSGALTVSAQSVELSGEHKSAGPAAITAQNGISLNNGSLGSDRAVSLQGGSRLQVSGGKIMAGDSINLAATSLSLDSGSALNATNNISFNAQPDFTGGSGLDPAGQFDNAGQVTAGNNLSVNAFTTGNSGGLLAKGQLAAVGNYVANQGVLQGNNVRIKSNSLNNGGTLQSADAVTLDAFTLENNGTLIAKGQLNAVSNSFDNRGTLQGSGVDIKSDALRNSGTLQSAGLLTLNGNSLDQLGTLGATGDGVLTFRDRISNTQGASLLSDGALTLSTGDLFQDGNLSGRSGLAINSDNLSSAAGASSASQGDIALQVGKHVDINGDVNADGMLTSTSGSLHTGTTAHLQGQNITLQAGQIALEGTQAAKQRLHITGTDLTHAGKSSGDDVILSASGSLSNQGSLVANDGLQANAANLSNTGTGSGKDINFTATGTLINAGALVAKNQLQVGTASLNNSGTLTAPQLSLSSDSLINSGLIQGTQTLALRSQDLTNQRSGSIATAGDLTLTLPDFSNSGLLSTGGALQLSGGSLTNDGEINALSLQSDNGRLTNLAGGKLLATGALQLANDQFNNSGLVVAKGLGLNAATLDNAGRIQGSDSLTLQAGTFTNRQGGELLTPGQLTLNSGDLTNAGLIQGEKLALTADNWVNSGNALSAGDATLNTKALTNSGKILGQQAVTLQGGTTDNSGWLLAKVLAFQGDLTNSGLIQGDTGLTLKGTSLTNQATGRLQTAGQADISATTLDNQGQLQGDALTVTTKNWQNSGNAHAASSITAAATEDINNSGALVSQQSMNLQSGTVTNTGTLAADQLSLQAPLLSNAGLLQGNSALAMTSAQIANLANGRLVSGSGLSLAPVQLINDGAVQVAGTFSVNGGDFTNNGQVNADALNATLTGTLNNGRNARLLARQLAQVQAQSLTNAGIVAGQQLQITGDTLQNQGLLQGDNALSAGFRQLDNQASGQLITGGALMLQGTDARNAGTWQGSQLRYRFGSLKNTGTLNGTGILDGQTTGLLDNSGNLITGGNASLNADSLVNSGKIMASSLTLRAASLNNSGLWQGSTSLDAISTGDLTQSSTGRALSGGDLLLVAATLNTAGTLQGGNSQITAGSWQNQGSLLSTGDLTAAIDNDLYNGGSLLSQGGAQLSAQNLVNTGAVLAEKTMMLSGGTLNNSGAIQGDTLSVTPASVTNQGNLIGLKSLTLGPAPQRFSMLLAQSAPARELVNNAGGQLLTQGTLNITAGNVTNNGTWQGQQILLSAAKLANGGAIQSADGLQLTLTDRLDAAAGSKISANGTAALQALTLANQGQWVAKNLMLKGDTLSNNGNIAGTEGLTVQLNGVLTQQQDKTLLSAGKLSLQAASLSNAGRIQGSDLVINTGTVDNTGRLQGDNSLQLSTSGHLTNATSGTVLSQNALSLTTPDLYNDGLIQGAGGTVSATNSATNNGRLLTGGALTFTTPQLVNNGWLQAGQLTLNASGLTNNGTLLADQQGTLNGNGFQNQGTAQAGNLAVNYQTLNNSGTLLGTGQLSVNAAQVNLAGTGRLFSSGGLTLVSNGFDQFGQVVALGDAVLNLANSFVSHNTLAAGNRLTLNSNGSLENQSTMQGQGVTLNAGGDLTNNGQITTGSADSSLTGNRIAMNGAGSLQGGGNVTLNSRSDVTLDGFTGTLGNLTISTPGSLVNTALLYAGQNLYLFANSIRNQRGDILAGNSLWMQRDGAGNANGEVINTSGTIETQGGDITIRTGNLLNQRDGFSSASEYHPAANSIPNIGQPTIKIKLSQLSKNESDEYIKTGNAPDKTFLIGSKQATATASGGAGRIYAGRKQYIFANELNNIASSIIAAGDMYLSGSTLNNKSYENSTENEYLTYHHVRSMSNNRSVVETELTYNLSGGPSYEKINSEQGLRAVIQAGENLDAEFSSDISNTNTTSNSGWTGNTISTPVIKDLALLNQTGIQPRQQIATTDKVSVGYPQWRDQLQGALKQVNGGSSLDNSAPDKASLVTHASGSFNRADLGQGTGLITGTSVSAANLRDYKSASVDISAYPIPSGDNGYFVFGNSKSPYLITLNPKLNGLGQLDNSLFGDLNALLGRQPGQAPQETRQLYTDKTTFLGSSYLLDRLNLKPNYDYRFLGDAAFDTRYVSNVVLNQTGSRYLNGIGSELDQMRYLMDNAASAQRALGLQFGVSLSAQQVASLDKSIVWWEAATINGETVMVPKVYLSSKDVKMHDGSVIAGNNVTLSGGDITNSGSTITAKNNLAVSSQNSVNNLNAGILYAGESLQLTAINNINNVSSNISGKKVALESINGDINNNTLTTLWQTSASAGYRDNASARQTLVGQTAAITSLDTLSLKAGNDINVKGASLSSGSELLMNAWHDIAITSNQKTDSFKINGFGFQNSSTQKITNTASQISAGHNLAIQSGHDLNVMASNLNAANDASLQAGNDLNLSSATNSQNSRNGNQESHSTGLDRTAVSSGGSLSLSAGQDINSQAAAIAATGNAALKAGRDINLNADATGSGYSERGDKKTVISETVRQQGTEIASGGSTTMAAGRDINTQATDVTAQRDIALQAGRDVNLNTATESDYYYKEETKTKKGFLSKKTTHTIEEDKATNEKGTQLSGNNVSVTAGNNLTVQGSSVAGQSGVALSAGNDVNVLAATDTQSTYRLKEEKKSGFGSSGLGISYGKQSSKSEYKGAKVTQSDARSLIGAADGGVTVSAGHNALVKGSDVVAGGNNGDITVTAKNIALIAGQDHITERTHQESKSSGIGLSLSGTLLDTIRNLRDVVHQNGSFYQQAKSVGTELGATLLDSPGLSLSYNHSSSKADQKSDSIYQSGSSLSASGSVLLKAKGNGPDGNILLQGSSVAAGNKAELKATNDVDIVTSQDSQSVSSESSSKRLSLTSGASPAGFVRMVGNSPNHGSPASPVGIAREQQTSNASYLTQHTSSVTGNTVSIDSDKGDINLSGSTVTGKQSVTLTAKQGNVNLTTGEDKQDISAQGGSTLIGSLGGDGYSGTLGWGSTAWNKARTGTQQSNLRSGVVSEQGNVSVSAGKDISLQGADVYAGNALNVDGRNINLNPSEDSNRASSNSKSAQYGVTAQVSGYAVSIAQAADKVADAHKNNSDPRLQAIYAAQAALTALSAATQNTAAIKVSVSATAGTSHQSVEQSSTVQSGSVLKSQGDTTLTAAENITGKGAKISGDNVALTAGKDIALSSAQDQTSQESTSGGNHYGVGVGFGLGGSQNGFSIELAASQNSANANGSSVTHHNSDITARGDLSVKAGQDVTLNGAGLKGNHVELNAGRNLNIASQQDQSTYDSHQSSSGFSASICVPPICAGVPVQGSASMSGSKIYNDYASVQQQSGIRAGAGGYNIYVGNHTQLDGAVIASSATPDKNHLSTGTLGWSDIDNHAKNGGSGYGISASTSGMPSAGLTQVKAGADSVTHSAVSAGTIDIRDPASQKQDLATLSRDTDSASGALSDHFNAQKVQDNLDVQREMTALGQQAIQSTFDYLKEKEKNEQLDKLKDDPAFNKLTPEQKSLVLSSLDKQTEEKYGIGSKMQIAAQAVSGVFSALAGGNASGAVAAGAAPLLAQMIKQASGDNDAMRILLHTLASGLIARAQGGSVAGAAAGGFTAAALGTNDALSKLFFGKEAALLTADEKQLIANIVTLAGAGVGGAVGAGTGAGSGGSAARTEVENNTLSVPQIESFAEKAKGCEARGDCGQIVKEMEDLSLKQQKEMIAVCSTNPAACKEKYGDIPANGMLVRKALDGLFDADVPSQLKNDISSFWAQQMEAEGVVTSTEFASQLENRYGMDKQQSEILAMAVLGAVTGGMGKAGASTPGKTISAKPEWLQNVQAGNKFNEEQSKNYPYNELYVNKPNGNGYYRVDSYNPAKGEIVSRKFTQFADITEATATSYIREAVNKYPAGATVANVPSSGDLGGSLLKGINILEIPPQTKPIPQSIIDIAKESGVVIRDTNGKVYK
ncbi:hemagglutinin repeat-containing protein [Pantoea stewartii]|uniref:hemagglutinin repeat-containing protein n=1 Tax=Pantoea stewartii TaxID=66269 RepID=UPI0025A231DB|nr:hemagglutinin repeat-containing protein [Pantoea stewartii]